MHLHYILPLLAAFFYSMSTLFIKRALSSGAGIMCIVFIANVIAIAFFVPLLIFDFGITDPSYWRWAVLCGIVSFIGMLLTFIAIRIGDLSIQTPIMGTKVIFVGAITVLISPHAIPFSWWAGAFISALGIIILGMPDKKDCKLDKRLVLTFIISLLDAIFYAISDVLMDQYADKFGESAFLAITIILTALLSIVLIPFFETPIKKLPKASWKWILWGSIFMGLEALTLYGALAYYGEATVVNILYGSRGIWAVVLVWALGRFFINDQEASLSKKVMLRRLCGAFCLFLAIVIVLID